MMAITEKLAIVCMDSITNPLEQNMLKSEFEKDGLEILDISYDQMAHFCGNVFEAKNKEGDSFLICSQQAWDHFTSEHKSLINQYHTELPIKIDTIERIGGGSARCMVAGVYF